jgi:hypothetical protein
MEEIWNKVWDKLGYMSNYDCRNKALAFALGFIVGIAGIAIVFYLLEKGC